MSHRAKLWSIVNILDGAMLSVPWNGLPAGTRGTLRYFGRSYATFDVGDDGIRSVPLVFVMASDETAARRRRS